MNSNNNISYSNNTLNSSNNVSLNSANSLPDPQINTPDESKISKAVIVVKKCLKKFYINYKCSCSLYNYNDSLFSF